MARLPAKSFAKLANCQRRPTIAENSRKRHSAKGVTAGVQDVYDYEPMKDRRHNIRLDLDEDEFRGAACKDDENGVDEDSPSRKRPRLIGEGEEDEQIASEEDEDIDSDAAFDESDEDAFAGSNYVTKMKRAKSKKRVRRGVKKKVKFAEVDLDEDDVGIQSAVSSRDIENESEAEEEEGEDDDFLDVLDVLDGRAHPFLKDENEPPGPQSTGRDIAIKRKIINGNDAEEIKADEDEEEAKGEEEEDEEEEEESEDDAGISASDDDEEDTGALDALDSFITGLETGEKRKATDENEGVHGPGSAGQVNKRKRLLKDRTESGIENEFNASTARSSKLSLNDLLMPLASKRDALSTLKKSIKPLVDPSRSQPLPAPLPTRTQERLEREAAYEQTKQEVDKWTDTMKRIREAERLSFPLQAPRSVKVSNLELTAKFKPNTEMESSIDRLLKSAKLHEDEINKTEDLMMKDLSVEEVAARRAELRKMRELAFRADAKAKRIAKIKSKTYRRIRKKERAKLMTKLDSTGKDDTDEDEERLKAEIERARERATLRHKITGKWAKVMKDRGELDVDQRRDINEMLDRGERLRRRIQGEGSGDDNNSETSGSDEDIEDEDGVIQLKANAFEEIQKIREENVEQDSGDSEQMAKNVFQMKFMKDAEARRNAALDREMDDLRKVMGALPEDDDKDDDGNASEIAEPSERYHGRMVFRPGPQSQTSQTLSPLPPPPLSAISEISTLRSHDSPALTIRDDPAPTPPPPSTLANPATASEMTNPWLVETSSVKVARRKNELIVGKNVTRAQKSEAALQKQLKKGGDEREVDRDDATVEISTEDVLLLDNSGNSDDVSAPKQNDDSAKEVKKKKKKDKKKRGKRSSRETEEYESDTNSELEEQEAALKKGKKLTAFQQRELVAQAFAGDNVVRQFADEKRKEIEADAPREVDMTLQGWGSWGGAGIKKTAPKPHLIKKVAGIDPKSRADYGKAHVIISERQDKKVLKFAVKDLPYPYTSKAQFEARMNTPLGVEWNTRVGFQRATLPRVIKKMGTIIDPLEKL